MQTDSLTRPHNKGPNYCWRPPAKFQKFAHELIDCGVDIIHGHSAHHVQGIEIYKHKPILFGCGDFIDDYAVDDDYR
jgi:poly-gamma-glutamate capsule biosynthesis protein CapA/YwtB (metallophosphatase superfamily)